MPKYSIVIPTYNHLEDCLKPCIESILTHTNLQDVEIIVVANGCTDGTQQYLFQTVSVKCIDIPEPAGFTKATNEGIKVASGQYIVILNNDAVILGDNWIRMLEAPFLSDEKVGITGSAKNFHVPTKHDFLLFFCVMIKKDVIDKLGLLDEVFNPGYGEDIDYCFKVRNAGYKVIQVPNDVNLSELRKPEEHVLQFPIWHKSSQTVHGVQGWADVVNRNEATLLQRYGNFDKHTYIGNSLDMILNSEIPAAIDAITAKMPDDGLLHGIVDGRTNVTLSKTGFLHHVFIGNDGKKNLKLSNNLPDVSSINTIKEHVLASGAKSMWQFGGRWEGGYLTQQDPEEIASYLFDYKDLEVDSYLEIGVAEGGVTRLFCDVVNVKDVTTIDIGWSDANYPFAFRNNMYNLRNTGKIDIFRGDSHTTHADEFLQGKQFDFVFIDADHTYDSVVKDTMLAMKYAKDGCIFAYHDHVAVEEIGNFYRDAVGGKFAGFIPLKQYVSSGDKKFGICTFKYIKEDVEKTNKPKISIVIPTYNHLEDCLKPCLKSISDFTDMGNVEVIVVANGCTDDTEKYINQLVATRFVPEGANNLYWNPFKLVSIKDACGFSKPVNEGIKASTGEYILILNNDTVIKESNWIELLLNPFDNPKVGITGPVESWYPFKPDYNFRFVAFSCALISKKLIDEIGLLDEELYAFGEDIDFCARAALAGYEIKPVPNKFPIIHEGAKTFTGGEHSHRSQLISRNLTKLGKRYFDKDLPSVKMNDIYLNTTLDDLLSDEVNQKVESTLAQLDDDGQITANINDKISCTISKTGNPIGIFVGKENLTALHYDPTLLADKSLAGIKNWVLSHGGIFQVGGMWYGGYLVQQNPNEFSSFLYDYKDRKVKNYLEIGVADGGFCRHMCDILDIDNVYHMDIGYTINPYFPTYRLNLINYKNSGKVTVFRGDTHLQKANDWLKAQKTNFDFIFIDGDHSYEGVLKDTELAMKYAEHGCIFAFHDHAVVEDITKFFNELKGGKYPQLSYIKEYVDKDAPYGISVFKYSKTESYNTVMIDYSKPTISVVIPTYNHLEDCLKPCLKSIINTTDLTNLEVIVVANGCTDGTRQYVESLGATFKLVWIDEPVGFIQATNAGIKVAKGDYIVFLNNDTEVGDGTWLYTLLQPFLKDEKVGITGPYKDWRFLWDNGKLTLREEYLVFYCAMIKREVLDNIGLLDEGFGMGYEEDIDFCVRAKRAGYKVVQVPKDIEDDLSITKEYLIDNPNKNASFFPVIHKDGKTFKNEKIINKPITSISEKYPKPYISLIIPTFNHLEDCLRPCLESIKKYTTIDNIEIIVVANGCTDDTREYVKSLGLSFKLLWMPEQAGFIKAVNAGIKQAMGEYVVILNNDTILIPQDKDTWLKILITPFLNLPAGISGPVKAWRDDVKAEYLLFWCVMIKSEVFEKIGLLDEEFGIGYHEDVDFCIRAQKAGYQLFEVPINVEYSENNKGDAGRQGQFPIVHKGGATFAPIYGQSEERLKKHVMHLYQKHEIKSKALGGNYTEDFKKGMGWQEEPILPPGWFGYGDQAFYQELIKQVPNGGRMVEVGVWQGLSLCSAAKVIKERNINVLGVDTFQGSPWEGKEGATVPEGVNIQDEFDKNITKFGLRERMTTCPLPSLEAAKTIEDSSIDLVFLDGDHRPESFIADITAWLPKLKPTGWLSGHDYRWSDSIGPTVEGIFGRDNVYSSDNIWYIIPENRRQSPPKVYDCCTFFNELDILEIRLNELDSVVDCFVICEATHTHQGQPKPLYFEENRQRFAPFLHKIIYLVVPFDEYPELITTWDREHFQRIYIKKALQHAKDNDIIILSDADEIVKADTVRNYDASKGVAAIEMPLFYFKLDWKLEEKWYKPRIFPFSATKGKTMQDFRGGNDYDYKYIISNGGWHFSFLGDKDSVKQKIQAYAHIEFNNDAFTNDQNITEAIEQGRDVFKRDLHFNKVQIDNTYPQFIQDNVNYYLQKGLISKRSLTPDFVEQCIEKAEQDTSNINRDVLILEGMSNDKTRHLFNNLTSFGGLNYLEVGCWRGATASATMSNNKLNTVTVIDNFSEFAVPNELQLDGFVHPRNEVVKNFEKFSSGNVIKVIEDDFFKVDLGTLSKIDMFFYDGNHSEQAQYQALRYALPALADTFIFIVDDYSWPIVGEPTRKSILELINSGEITCLYQQELESELPSKDIWPDGWNHLYTLLSGKWRNGVYIGLFKKNPPKDPNKQYVGWIGESGWQKSKKAYPVEVKDKVYDCFSFFNELDLLEIRLEELAPYVDYFVISEMRQTHSGLPKPLYFEENKKRFSKFLNKIIHVVPPDIETPDPWVREHYQRDYMKEALRECNGSDIIIVSDLDEIPRGSKIQDYNVFWTMFFEQNQYSYYLNYNVGISPIGPGTFSRITRYANLKDLSLTGLRYKELKDEDKISDGGWHFSWMGGGNKIVEKLDSWAHQEFNILDYKDPNKINEFINSGKEHLGREGVGETKMVDIDSSFPRFIQMNQDYLTRKGLIKGRVVKEFVRIIMPYYNDKYNLTRTVSAIFAQDFQDWKLIIVDDGSDEAQKASKVLASHPKIKIIEKKNGGPSSARNRALDNIRRPDIINDSEVDGYCTHVAFCDSDDIWEPNYLSSQLANIGDADIVYCSVNHVFENGQQAIPYGIPDPPEYPGRKVMLDTPFIYISGVLCTRKILKLGDFDDKLNSIEDWDMWLRADKAGFKFKKNNNKLLTYTVKDGMAGKRTQVKWELLKSKHVYGEH